MRIYGLRGRPFPWSQQRLKIETPILKVSYFAFSEVFLWRISEF
jgi:hypothetical protein